MSSEEVVEVDDVEAWETTVEKSPDPSLVMFYTHNCPHCHNMGPFFASYTKEFEGKVRFVKVNIADNLMIAAKYGAWYSYL